MPWFIYIPRASRPSHVFTHFPVNNPGRALWRYVQVPLAQPDLEVPDCRLSGGRVVHSDFFFSLTHTRPPGRGSFFFLRLCLLMDGPLASNSGAVDTISGALATQMAQLMAWGPRGEGEGCSTNLRHGSRNQARTRLNRPSVHSAIGLKHPDSSSVQNSMLKLVPSDMLCMSRDGRILYGLFKSGGWSDPRGPSLSSR